MQVGMGLSVVRLKGKDRGFTLFMYPIQVPNIAEDGTVAAEGGEPAATAATPEKPAATGGDAGSVAITLDAAGSVPSRWLCGLRSCFRKQPASLTPTAPAVPAAPVSQAGQAATASGSAGGPASPVTGMQVTAVAVSDAVGPTSPPSGAAQLAQPTQQQEEALRKLALQEEGSKRKCMGFSAKEKKPCSLDAVHTLFVYLPKGTAAGTRQAGQQRSNNDGLDPDADQDEYEAAFATYGDVDALRDGVVVGHLSQESERQPLPAYILCVCGHRYRSNGVLAHMGAAVQKFIRDKPALLASVSSTLAANEQQRKQKGFRDTLLDLLKQAGVLVTTSNAKTDDLEKLLLDWRNANQGPNQVRG